nr:hypothetical protein [Tanacetum cinerariifolium]
MIEKLQVEKWADPKNGHATRKIKHHDFLLRAVQTLRDRSMVNDFAVVAHFLDDDIDDVYEYRQGKSGYTLLPCVLAGLANAPQYLISDSRTNGCMVASDADSVILSADACGGDSALAFANIKPSRLSWVCKRIKLC